jgi:hypothetical protein
MMGGVLGKKHTEHGEFGLAKDSSHEGGGGMLNVGAFIRKGMQVDGITYEDTYKAQGGSQTQTLTLWFNDPLKQDSNLCTLLPPMMCSDSRNINGFTVCVTTVN